MTDDVVVLVAYATEVLMYFSMAVYMLVSMIRNHLAHRPIRWLLAALALLFLMQVPEMLLLFYVRLMEVLGFPAVVQSDVAWAVSAVASFVAVVAFYAAFRLAVPLLRKDDDGS